MHSHIFNLMTMEHVNFVISYLQITSFTNFRKTNRWKLFNAKRGTEHVQDKHQCIEALFDFSL